MSVNQKPSLLQLFLSFLRLGLTAFGGPSMVAYIRKMAVEQKNWLDAETFNDGVALCQTIPGATAMQTAAYVGLQTRGVIGAGASYIGFGFPAFLMMMGSAALYKYAHNLPVIVSTFSGLQAIIVAIIANAAVSFGKNTLKNWQSWGIAGVAAALFAMNVNPILVILMAAIGGIMLLQPKQPNSIHPVSSEHNKSNTRQLLFIVAGTAAGFILLFFVDQNLFSLATLMFRIDLVAFGGGFASVPLMFHEIVQVRNWMASQTLMDGIILGQVTPGPIVITATFIGYILGGPFGGVVATIAIFLPSFMMVVGLTPYFDRLRASPVFNKAISGVLSSFVGLLFSATINFALNVHWDLSHLLLAGLAFAALLLKTDILWVVVLGTIASMVLFR